MIFTTRNTILFAVALGVVLATQGNVAAPQLPNPILIFMGQEHVVVSGKKMTRYTFDVFNKEAYPDDFFVKSPKLPPCGSNPNSARTWVDIYDQNGKRLNGFCALGKPADLNKLWFALDRDELPPSWVYIEFTDRQTNRKYKSNLAETTL